MLRKMKLISMVVVIVSLVCMLVAPLVIDSAQNLYKNNHRERIKLIDRGEYSEVSSEIYAPPEWSYLQYVYVGTLAVGVFFEVCAPRVAIVFGVVFIICEIINLYNKKRQ